MARQDAGVLVSKRQVPPQRRLEYLLNETYVKIDELKELLRKEAAITGIHGTDLGVGRMFSRQDYLVTLCAEACNAAAANANANNHVHVHAHGHGQLPLPPPPQSSSSSSHHHHVEKQATTATASRNEQARRNGSGSSTSKLDKDDAKPDGSWYGSLDRSLAKKKKHQFFDKKRRHTKTIGSMAGLDVIKKSVELKPDEQYEIGLPAAPKVTSSRSSIFPMTQHQYYTALMESKMTKKPAYPLEVRQQPQQPQQQQQQPHPPPQHQHHQSQSQYPHPHQSRPTSSWGYLDENKNMKKQHFEHQQQHGNIPPPPLPPIAPVVPKQTHLVPLPCRSLGSEIAFSSRHSSRSSSSKKWYETNLDENNSHATTTTTTMTTQNPSPSPSMMSSNRGSSRGSVASGMDAIDGAVSRMTVSSPANESAEFNSKSSESSESWSGAGNEVTKPFEMSDYYKYSTKFRSRTSPSEENSNMNGYTMGSTTSISHSRTPSQVTVRQGSFDGSSTNGFRDTNGNPAVGPKLPPKQRRNQNKSISSAIIFEGDIVNGDPNKEVWITNEPTFV